MPDKFGAMTTKELRQSLRRGSFVFPFLGIQLLALAAIVVEFQAGAMDSVDKSGVGLLNPALMWESGPFWMVVSLFCALVLPLGGIMLMGQELEEGNHELLLLTKVSRWRVVCGKFITLWGLCALTFLSLLPYVVIRYLVGGIEWWYELACAGTVLGISAIFCAGVIGASAFKNMGVKIIVLILFLGSVMAGTSTTLVGFFYGSRSAGLIYHLNALAAIVAYSTIGLALARSKIRLVLHLYEAKPSSVMIGLLIVSPFVIGLTTLFTLGYGGCIATLGVALISIQMDKTPRAPKWIEVPPPNIPKVESADT